MSRDQNMEEFLSPSEPTPAQEMKSATMEPTLDQILEELVPALDDCHEIIKGLNRVGMTTWGDFVLMFEEDFLTIPISSNAIRIVSQINNLVWQNIIDKMPGADLASTYAPKASRRLC